MLCIFAYKAIYIFAHKPSYLYIYMQFKTQFTICKPLALQKAAVSMI